MKDLKHRSVVTSTINVEPFIRKEHFFVKIHRTVALKHPHKRSDLNSLFLKDDPAGCGGTGGAAAPPMCGRRQLYPNTERINQIKNASKCS